MTFDQSSAFHCTFSHTHSICCFLYILVSAGIFILFLYTNCFEEFKICQTLLGITFKSKDVWSFLKLILFLEASCSTLWWVVGLRFGGRPVNFLVPYSSVSCKKLLITFLDLFISLAINEKENPLSLNTFIWIFSISDKAHLLRIVKTLLFLI